ncbi:MAG: hypothetical protein KGQ62_03490 [Gammaproteobacteria bacterium]|nr:hypothetical protein [Gammaproteobacteria bacterium]MBU6508934.1 hypothetical protein [Gammaproteobacteria bacterium]MDE1983635.1 hypothetical protein [Gammaproteobacteria bacterium]MDE2108813.1 hypothetical protein [Gammaproteobacteria bacterium]
MTNKTLKILAIVTAALLSFSLSSPSWAVRGSSAELVFKGKIQGIDYLHHAITINGQIYVVASTASFIGVASFSVLHIGMPIAYTLGTDEPKQEPGAPPPGPRPGDPNTQPENTGPPVIISITWLPGGV